MDEDKLDTQEDIIEEEILEDNDSRGIECVITVTDEPEEEEECNHVHINVMIAAGKRKKPRFRKPRMMFSVALMKNGSGLPDWESSDEEGHLWTKEELAADRQKKIDTFVPLLLIERRGRRLLRKHLNANQWKAYIREGAFHVKSHGKHFRIHGYYGVQELDANGRDLVRYCLHAKKTDLPQSDVLIMQKLMIEAEYDEFIRIANKIEVIHREDYALIINPEILACIDAVEEFNDNDYRYHEAYVLYQKMQNDPEFTHTDILTVFKEAAAAHLRDKVRHEEWEKAFADNNITETYQKNDIYDLLGKGQFASYRRKIVDYIVDKQSVQLTEAQLKRVLQDVFTVEEIEEAFSPSIQELVSPVLESVNG